MLNTTIFDAEEVAWLLRLQRGAQLRTTPEEYATRLEKLYHREGFTAAKVTASFDPATGTLTLDVDEGRVEAIEYTGVTPALERRIVREFDRAGLRTGEPYNEPAVERALNRAIAITQGAFRPGEVRLVERSGQRVLVVPVSRRDGDFTIGTGTHGREDLFSPVDGFAPALRFSAVAYDRSGFNHTYVTGFASWKFGPDVAGFSLGVERPLLPNGRLFVGGEIHDLTASDDLWRLSATEQALVAFTFKNTFRDYHRRRGMQLHAGVRPGRHQEIVAAWRWDRHEPLENATDFSLFRRDREFRPNLPVADSDLNALVLAYTFDSRGLDHESIGQRFERHLLDDLFRATPHARLGWRVDWTSEIAGRRMGGDQDFARHILNLRGVTRLGPHQSIAARGLFGWSDGVLPPERQFALGGIGSIHGYRFKEAVGAEMTLFNAEYALHLDDTRPGSLRALVFFDAGRVRSPIRGNDDWMRGIGVGLQGGPVRLELGFKLDDIPRSRQVLVRLGRSF